MIKKEESSIVVNWSSELIKNSYLNKAKDVESMDLLYLNYLAPFSKEYFGPNHASLIFGGHSFKEISEITSLHVRDGLIPLSIFFNEMKPEDLNIPLCVSKDLWFIVPTAWREKVRYYEIKSDVNYSKENSPKKILISGMMNSTFSDEVEFESSIKKLADSLGKEALSKAEIYAYFPSKRNDLWGSWEEENVLKYSSVIYKNLKVDIQTPKWEEIEMINSFKDYLYYEINNGLFIKDSYVTQMALSRGAGLLKPEKIDDRFKKISEVKTSLYHSVVFYEFDYERAEDYVDPLQSRNIGYVRRILEFQNKNTRLNFRWEQWYASYLKKFYQKSLSLNS